MAAERVRICAYCNELIDKDAPAAQTISVDVESLTGRNDSRAVVSRIRSYHIEPNCYRMMRHEGLKSHQTAPDQSIQTVSADAHKWSAAFGLTEQETMSSKRTKFNHARSPYVLRIARKTR